MENSDNAIRVQEFWEHQATTYGAADIATAPDSFYRQLEIDRILPHIWGGGARILDVGCGNGFSTEAFAKAHPNNEFIAVDYSPAMIRAAEGRPDRQKNVTYQLADVAHLGHFYGRFDIVISERCLINLGTWARQQHALRELRKCVTDGGEIILVENFNDGLRQLNRLRGRFDLPPIGAPWHNRYLELQELYDFLVKENIMVAEMQNIGNLYYIASRVIYAAMCDRDGVNPNYAHPINEIASQLPSLGDVYAYSPNYLHVLRAAS